MLLKGDPSLCKSLIFFDNILVYSKTLNEHKQYLAMVLEVLQHHVLCANWKTYCSGQTCLEYLGPMISGKGTTADEQKIEAMVAWPTPTNICELHGFLGVISTSLSKVITR